MTLRNVPEFPIDKIYTLNKALRREDAWGLKINIYILAKRCWPELGILT
jgi:hypothetical protein